jgi:hypothetical protein
MECITYTLDFHGRLSSVRPGVFELDAIGEQGAVLLTELSMTSGEQFDEAGTISLGQDAALHFRSIAPGHVCASPEAGVQQGSAQCGVDAGEGALAGARGVLTSNFLIGATGEVTDRRIVVLFVPHQTHTESIKEERQ